MLGFAARLRRWYRKTAVLPLLLLSARIQRYRGRPDLAKAKLLRAVALVPSSFRAHLRLGALFLEEREFYRAKREFLLAREISPGRFRRVYPHVTGKSGDANINLFYFPGYTDHEPEPEAPKNFLAEFIGEPKDERGPGAMKYGDFRNFSEYRKFTEMGPFSAEETACLDWDDVERQFQEDAESLEN